MNVVVGFDDVGDSPRHALAIAFFVRGPTAPKPVESGVPEVTIPFLLWKDFTDPSVRAPKKPVPFPAARSDCAMRKFCKLATSLPRMPRVSVRIIDGHDCEGMFEETAAVAGSDVAMDVAGVVVFDIKTPGPLAGDVRGITPDGRVGVEVGSGIVGSVKLPIGPSGSPGKESGPLGACARAKNGKVSKANPIPTRFIMRKVYHCYWLVLEMCTPYFLAAPR